MAIAGGFGRSPDGVVAGLERSLGAMAIDQPMRVRHWRGQNAALSGCDHAELAEAQSDGGSIAALFDGQLHDTAELRRRLGIEADRPASAAELLIAAYRRWGEDMLDRFTGRFACALWDGGSRRLLLGCDVMGTRALHYWRGDGLFLFASEPRGLHAHAPVPRRIDDLSIAQALTIMPTDPGRSLYREIGRVPGGHVLVVDAGSARLHRYWRPEHLPILRLKTPDDYAEALRTTLARAVSDALPATGLVGCTLSAGLDSSSVTVLAAQRLAEQGRDPAILIMSFRVEGWRFGAARSGYVVSRGKRRWLGEGERQEQIVPG